MQQKMSFVNIVFLCTFLYSLPLAFSGTPANYQSEYLLHFCPNSSHAGSVKFRSNLGVLLNRSLYHESGISLYSSVTEGEDPDQVYGLFLCRPDLPKYVCQSCIGVAALKIVENCQKKEEAIIWYNECFLRYSNRAFFSKLETQQSFSMWNTQKASAPDIILNQKLGEMFQNLSAKATSSDGIYAMGKVEVSNLLNLYGIVQCTRDLRISNCDRCLKEAVVQITNLAGAAGGLVFMPSCYIRYEVYPFFAVEYSKDEAVAPSSISSPPHGMVGIFRKNILIIITKLYI